LAKRNRPDTAKSTDTARSGESSASSTTWRGKRRKKEASQENEQMRDQIKKKKGELEALVRDLRDKLEDEEMNDLPQADAEAAKQTTELELHLKWKGGSNHCRGLECYNYSRSGRRTLGIEQGSGGQQS
jgi:predicted aminopeptidase